MESIGAELQFLTPRPFVGEQLDALRSISEERRYRAGELVAKVGEPMDRFVVVLKLERGGFLQRLWSKIHKISQERFSSRISLLWNQTR